MRGQAIPCGTDVKNHSKGSKGGKGSGLNTVYLIDLVAQEQLQHKGAKHGANQGGVGAGARLSDYLSASLLVRVFPAELVHAIFDEHGCNSQRVRSFPAVAGVYYCMALSLYPEAAYEEVFAVVAQGMAWAAGAPEPPRVAKSAIAQVRGKIGVAPLHALQERACDTGAQLLWRCAVNRQLPVVEMLDDGSYISVIYPDAKSRKSRMGEMTLRVIEYSLPGISGAQERYRLLTTLLFPKQAPALELATLYHERWEVEAVFDELKTHLVQRRRTLRSKTPEGVRQEFYGWVLAHYAVCWLMHEAASAHQLRQRSLSFTGHVHLLRRAQPRSGAFSSSASDVATALVQ